jgi:DNA-binding transcriptional regulator YbjK
MNILQREEEEWVGDRDTGKIEDLQRYLSQYPQGRYSEQARNKVAYLTDDKEIRDVVSHYERVSHRRDLDQLISLWPTFPARSQQRARDLFKTAKSISMTLSIADLKITGNVAMVTCNHIESVIRQDEGGGKTQDSVTFKMGKQGDRWIIESEIH